MTEPPPWLSLDRQLWLAPTEQLAPGAQDATPATPDLAATLRLLSAHGWDGARAPRDAWAHALGELAPYPEEKDFSASPTLGPLDRLVWDGQVTDIHLNGPGRAVLVRRSGSDSEWAAASALHPDWLPWLVRQLARRGHGAHGRLRLSGTADATWPGRAACRVRYEIALPPACAHGPALTLRVLRPGALTLDRLVAQRMLPSHIAAWLAACVEAGVTVITAGTPGTGKTTLLRALLDRETLADARLICIEDAPELALVRDHAVELTASREQPMLQLVYAAQRMNPSRIVLGEVRGAEAYALLAAMRSGTPVLTTVHGLSASGGLDAFIGMALEAPEARGSVDLVRMTLNSQPLVVVALARDAGVRRVSEVAELVPSGGAHHPLLQARWSNERGRWRQISPPSDGLTAQLRASASAATRAALDSEEEELDDHPGRL